MRLFCLKGVLLLLFLCSAAFPIAVHATPPAIVQLSPNAEGLAEQAKQLYQTDRFSEAAAVWQQAADAFKQIGDLTGQAMALSNLSLTAQQLGDWRTAETAIQAAITLLTANPDIPLYAQALDIQGRLQVERGQASEAIATWRRAAELYTQLHDEISVTRNRINQAQALQALGLYRQAEDTLTAANQALQAQPESQLKAIGLRSLGNVQRVMGELDTAERTLQQSLTIARNLGDTPAISEALLSLGNTSRAQEKPQVALEFYQQAAAIAPSTATRVAAQLRQLSLLIELGQGSSAEALLSSLVTEIDSLTLSQAAIYARIELAQAWIKAANPAEQNQEIAAFVQLNRVNAAQLLTVADQQAKTLGDRRAESYALGTLGSLQEQTGQWAGAKDLTQQALMIAQAIEAPEIAYQWQWQLGRLLKGQGDRQGATAAYGEAVKTLQLLRYDLVTVNPDVQFSFRDQVEPVYRTFVDLLLQEANPSPDTLQKARQTIEQLQLAELDNFFREACLAPAFPLDAIVDRNDPTAAVIYAVILDDRLEVILKLPQQPDLRHYATAVPQAQVEQTLEDLLNNLKRPSSWRAAQDLSQQVYSWLIQPIAADLVGSQVKTLVFVLDGFLRNIPMAALYHDQQYLIEQYSIVLSPGLQLVDPQPLEQQPIEALVAGLVESPDPSFQRLGYVTTEIDEIEAEVSSQVLLNQQFTSQAFQSEMNANAFNVVHLATHGNFSSEADDTYILAWDKRITVNELADLLQVSADRRLVPLELLVLSACQTATGDKRAVLGLAGVALRAGARSTVASLWSIGDDTTARFMSQFYKALSDRSQTRAEALRQAQIALLKTVAPEPAYWAPYVLVGSWL